MLEEEVDFSMDCAFCEEYKEGDLLLMMTDAVYAKHTITQNDAYINYIDAIMRLQEPTSKEEAEACCKYHEYIAVDETDQFMKRHYSSTEFQGKINMLTQYYKFHSNIPRVIQPKIQRVLSRYHDKKREYDYKRIKRLLKEEQGISITSVQESQTDYSDQEIEKKSRYSTLLNQLDQSSEERNTGMSDSNLLKDLCRQIERVLPSKKKDSNFQIKGAFYHDTIFEKYLKKEQMKTREKLRLRNQERKVSIGHAPRKFNLNIFSQRNKREKDYPLRHSKQLKRKDKEGKPVYNTNIKIQIKNAMFCTEDHFKNIHFESQNTNGSKNLIRNDIFKKRIMGPLNFFDSRQPSSKFLTQIYKPSQNDSRKKITSTQQRTYTKQSVNRSQSKERKKTLPRQSFSQSQLKRGTNGSHSARKIVVISEQNPVLNKGPSRALSSNNLKTRSLSSQSVTASASLAATSNRRHNFTIQKRPIQLISKYGSSNLKQSKPDIKRSEQKMNEAISRKLTLKVG